MTTLAPVATIDQTACGFLRRVDMAQKRTITAQGEGEDEAMKRLKAELAQAFAAPDDAYRTLSAADVIVRNREQSRQ